MYKTIVSFLLILTVCIANVSAEPGRWEKNISGEGWQLWLDKDAEWVDDDLYLAPFDISLLPLNPPSCGWDDLHAMENKLVTVPGTVEQYYWSGNGNPVGRAGDYRGVSWWSTTFQLDRSLKGKQIILSFVSVNLRAEVYVNNKLVFGFSDIA